MGKNNKGQKPAKGSKDSFSLAKVADTVHQQQQVTDINSGDVIAGFDFLKSFVSDDAMGDSPIAVCLRKMAKKDAMTKIKALQDYIELIQSSEGDITPYLQFWSRCYCRLTMCGDHRVRELAQNALAVTISKAGRQFASCLKVVLPYCLLSNVDCVASVASAAKSCLESSFNDSRRIQAIAICNIPIFELISSIIKFTNPYLADKSLGLDEEEVLRRDRLLSACLGGWSIVALNRQAMESAAAATEPEETVTNIILDILSSPEFESNILKSDSQLILSALHTWIVTLCQTWPAVVTANARLFLSTVFLVPQSEGEVPSRIVDVGSWQSAAALSSLVGNDPFWKQPKFEKQFWKRLTFLLTNGPAHFVAPPTPFFAVSNIPALIPLSEAVMILLRCHLSSCTNESALKFVGRFIDSVLQGILKAKPFHARRQEMPVFCDTVSGCLLTFLGKTNCSEDIVNDCKNGSLKMFSNALKLDPICSIVILPYLVKLFTKFLSDSLHFGTMFKEAMLCHVQFLVTGPESPSNESTNFASFFNCFLQGRENNLTDVDRNLLVTLAQIIISAINSMRTLASCGNVFNFLCSLSPSIVSFCAADPSSYQQLCSEMNNFVDEIVTDDVKWQANSDNIITKLLLRWDVLLSEEGMSRLLKKLCQHVKSLSEVIDLMPRLAGKFQSDKHFVSTCSKLLSSSAFFDSPQEVTNLLFTILEACKLENRSVERWTSTIASLLEAVASQMIDCSSAYYMARAVAEQIEKSHDNNANSPVEILLAWLENQSDLRSKCASPPQTMACFAEIFQKIGNDLAYFDETLENCLAVLAVVNCYGIGSDFAEKHVQTVRSPRFLAILRDVLLFSKENCCHLLLGFCGIFSASCQELLKNKQNVEKMPSFKLAVDSWIISHCYTTDVVSADILDNDNNDCSIDLQMRNLVFASAALFFCTRTSSPVDFALKDLCEFVVEAVSAIEITPSTPWLSIQLLEFVDELLLLSKENGERLLIAFVSHCRSLSSLKFKWAFSYLLSGRHSSSSLRRVIAIVDASLVEKFDERNCNDLWLLSETFNRNLRCDCKLTTQLTSLLKRNTTECLNAIVEGCTTAEPMQQSLLRFSQLTASLATNFCSDIYFDEEMVKSVLKSWSDPSLESVFLRDNIVVDLEDKTFFRRVNATAHLAIFFNCCLRYTSKLTNIDPIMCSVCSWISTASNVIDAAGRNALSSDEKVKLSRFLVAVTECAHSIHELFNSKKFAFLPSETQRSEFTEFYQPQYLDALIQLLMSLWLRRSASNETSFFSRVLNNRNIQDQATFAIVSCLYKASSVDVITHVNLEPLFCADESYLPEDVQTVIGRLSPLITDSTVDDVRVHLAIHTVLSTLSPTLSGIYLSLSGDISQQRDNDDDFVLTPPRVWLREIAKLTEPVSLAVTSDSWRIHPEPVSSYLFIWLLVLRLAGSLPSEVRPPMVNFLRKSPEFQALLLNVFALAPATPSLIDCAPFDSLPQLVDNSEGVPVVSHLSCYMIRELLASFPAVVRSWLNDQVASLRRDIVSYVASYLSPALRAVELSKVRLAEFDEAIKIRVMTATGELNATFQSDQVRLDLTIKLPDDYPLSVPSIECKQNILSSLSKLWLRQLTALLICQNGTVLDALLLWQKLITDKLGRLEECTICYSIVQGSNLALPKRQCRTCKKLFHSACLFKWFESSGNVTCPLCREQFY